MNELTRILAAEIETSGPIPFDRFMELALYHPEHGYYRRGRAVPRTGRTGDFFTSVSVGPLFGRLLARQFLEMWERLGTPEPFWIIEQGAEDAQLASDILDWCRSEAPSFFAAIRYAIIEPSAKGQALQREKIGSTAFAEKAIWFESLNDLAALQPVGVFFSNELVDAFPVRVLTRQGETWLERRVGCGPNSDFIWNAHPIDDADLTETASKMPLPPLDGYTTEIHLHARRWMRDVAKILARGYVLTLDYGYPSTAYYADFRTAGTLTAYRNHKRSGDVLHDPGGQDITAHVEFTGLMEAGKTAGLDSLGFLDQQHFLMGVAHDELSGATSARTGIAENIRAWQTLTHPSYLGARFHALLQARDAPGALAGLRFAGPAHLI